MARRADPPPFSAALDYAILDWRLAKAEPAKGAVRGALRSCQAFGVVDDASFLPSREERRDDFAQEHAYTPAGC